MMSPIAELVHFSRGPTYCAEKLSISDLGVPIDHNILQYYNTVCHIDLYLSVHPPIRVCTMYIPYVSMYVIFRKFRFIIIIIIILLLKGPAPGAVVKNKPSVLA